MAFHGCSEIIRTRNFTVLTVCATIFRQFMAAFHFLLLHMEKDHFTLDILNSPILNVGPSEKFVFVDHPKKDLQEREFKP